MKFTFADAVTILNLIAGIFAIYSAISGELQTAIILIGAAMVFDFLDGRIARYYGSSSEFGKEMDSLADLSSFGIAPGVILLTKYGTNDFLLVGAILYAAASAFRLARFNISKKRDVYEGLTVPAAGFVALLPTFFSIGVLFHTLLLILLAGLMISKIPIKKP